MKPKHPIFRALVVCIVALYMAMATGALHATETLRLSQLNQPGISIAPVNFRAGTSVNLAVQSRNGFDLSPVGLTDLKIMPADGISNLQFRHTGAGLALSFDLGNCAAAGSRMLTIDTNATSAQADFKIEAIATDLSIDPNAVTTGMHADLTIRAIGCFDLSQVGEQQVLINPPNGLSHQKVSAATPSSLIFSFDLDGAAAEGNRSLSINGKTAFLGIVAGPGIELSQDSVTTGGPSSLTVLARGGLDLSGVTAQQVHIDPSSGLAKIVISNVTAQAFELSFDLETCAASGRRTLTVDTGSRSQSAIFDVLSHQTGPPIPLGILDNVWVGIQPLLRIRRVSPCFDMSQLIASQIRVSPPDGIFNISILERSAQSITVSFGLAPDTADGDRKLILSTGDRTVSTLFSIFRPPSQANCGHGAPRCSPGQDFCIDQANGCIFSCIEAHGFCPLHAP